ncbi:hypothetical protein [Myceligenerans salitolerans]|uniref:AbiEi antitoxin C-terminal domain-containing protein n=1 Tax=Myceligenerans salitolerans TaxID=1230528 RepID=A0ABS3I7T3_9MICO|nr:hypothetical protein [Myceligenerans salitolerans]MBO0609070.1 hypothetical protein [Myceligenerans salitolerans]
MTSSEILLAQEHDRDRLRRYARSGDMVRVRRGAYTEAVEHRPRDLVLLKVQALHRQLRAEHVFSHKAAAVLHGLPTWTLPERIDLIQRYHAGSRASHDVARHRTALPSDQVTTTAGVPVTNLARTVVDCALTLHPMEALVIADAACRANLDVGEALKILGARRNRRGTLAARHVITSADGGAQSVWESRTRYILLRAGVPELVTQMPVRTRLGTFHTDLGIPRLGVGIEFDGKVKYRTGALRIGHDGADELFREKRRGDAIAEAVTLVRTTAADRPDALVDRVVHHLPPDLRELLRVDRRMPPAL